MAWPMIIAGFPGIGKTSSARLSPHHIKDLDSSTFSKTQDGTVNLSFPANYVAAMVQCSEPVILISSHRLVRDTLRIHSIAYTLVFPLRECRDEYRVRYEQRGSSLSLIETIEQNWDAWIDECEAETFPTKIRLGSRQFLSDAIGVMRDSVGDRFPT